MYRPRPSKEQQLLFDLLKGAPPATLEGIDTTVLFDLFRRHRLFPLAGDLMPLMEEKERERWKQAIQTRTIRSMHQFAILGKLLHALTGSGIKAISMKGPVLAFTLFGHLGGRHSSDLDILVPYKDLHQSIEILGREGFELTYPRSGLSDRQWRYYSRFKKDIHLYNRDQGILLELHYNIENYLGLKPTELDQFFRHIEEVNIGGSVFNTMQNHQTFLYLTVHGAVHQYRRLFWLRDIAEGLKRWDLDHQRILEDAKAMRVERMVAVSMELARELFNVELPAPYSIYIAENRRIIGKLKWTSQRMILGPEFPAFAGKLEHHLFMLRLKPEIRHYLRTIREILNRLYIGKILGGH